MGSNHIWKTSSGKRPLRSHFTVSQRFEEVVSEDIEGEDGRLFTIAGNTPLGRSTVGQGKTPLKRKEGGSDHHGWVKPGRCC
jgi:hypothetical protein